MTKNDFEFKVKDVKNINKLLTQSYKKINEINNPDELSLLHDKIMDFIINCELMIQHSETNLNKKELSPKTQKLINGYIDNWLQKAQVVYEKLSTNEKKRPMKVNTLKSMIFWLLKRRDYQEIDLHANDRDYSVYTPSPDRSYHYITQPRNYTDEDLPAGASY